MLNNSEGEPLGVLVPKPVSVKPEESAVLKLKGLPYSTTEQQILDFFHGFSVCNVAFVYEPDGRPSGLAFAEFNNREEALQAMARNGEYLGDRYVRLLHVPRQEMEEQVRMGTLAIPGQANKLRQRNMRGGGAGGGLTPAYGADPSAALLQTGMLGAAGAVYAPVNSDGTVPLAMRGVAGMAGMAHVPTVSMASMRPTMGAMGIGHMAHMPGAAGPLGPMAAGGALGMGISAEASMITPPAGVGVGAMSGLAAGMGSVPAYQAMVYQMNGLSMGGPRPLPTLMAGQAHAHATLLPTGAPLGVVPPVSAAYAPASSALVPPPIAVIGTDSRTVKIRGLPFRATPLDILNFFEGYVFVPESLQLGVDALGRPSGEAWLTFESSDEALRGVRERNRQYLGSRYLELSLT